jgi:hypothetical protein
MPASRHGQPPRIARRMLHRALRERAEMLEGKSKGGIRRRKI